MVMPFAVLLAIPLTVAVHRLKKPFIYAGFNNLITDETRMISAEMFLFSSGSNLCFIYG